LLIKVKLNFFCLKRIYFNNKYKAEMFVIKIYS
jgi:hypothetical protein